MLSFATHESRQLPVRIIEVSPRDGLQHEALFVPTARKIDLINALSRTGVTEQPAPLFRLPPFRNWPTPMRSSAPSTGFPA